MVDKSGIVPAASPFSHVLSGSHMTVSCFSKQNWNGWHPPAMSNFLV